MRDAGTVALTTAERDVSYEELVHLSEAIASKAYRGSVVLFSASNDVESIAAYVGFLRGGVVPLMVGAHVSDAVLRSILEAYEPEWAWLPADGFEGGVFEGMPCAYRGESHRLVGVSEGSGWRINPELALLLSTSGSTGSPKYVRLSHSNLKSNAQSIAAYLGLGSQDRSITTLPFSYSYGISVVNSHLLAGASLALTDESVLARGFWSLAEGKGVTNLNGVPYTYAMLRRLRFERRDLPRLRFVTQAGGRLPVADQEWLADLAQERGFDLYVMYGQTEATARMAFLDPGMASSKLGCIGKAIPGGSLSLVDEGGRTVEGPGVAGELRYSGPNVSLGYALSRADLEKGDENKGVLLTGDVAERDEDGCYRIVGRKKRFLKMYGNRVNLDEVEAFLSRLGMEAACVGSDDAMRVFTTTCDETAVKDAVSSFTGLYAGSFSVSVVDGFPRNAAGKVLYADLEKRHESE